MTYFTTGISTYRLIGPLEECDDLSIFRLVCELESLINTPELMDAPVSVLPLPVGATTPTFLPCLKLSRPGFAEL